MGFFISGIIRKIENIPEKISSFKCKNKHKFDLKVETINNFDE